AEGAVRPADGLHPPGRVHGGERLPQLSSAGPVRRRIAAPDVRLPPLGAPVVRPRGDDARPRRGCAVGYARGGAGTAHHRAGAAARQIPGSGALPVARAGHHAHDPARSRPGHRAPARDPGRAIRRRGPVDPRARRCRTVGVERATQPDHSVTARMNALICLLWASSVTRNQITAFILAVTVTFALILVGLDPLIVGLPPQLGAIAASLGVLSHFSGLGRGVIDLRDAVYFVTLAALFLIFAYVALLSRKLTPQGEALKRLRLGTVLLATTMLVVNLFGRHIGGRIDLTPGNSFTLSRATRQLLRTLPDLVTIKLFASAALPPEVAFLKRDVDDVLSDYRTAGRGKVMLVITDPSADSAALKEARTLGIPPVQFNVLGQAELQVKEGYLGLAIRYADGVKTMPFVQQTNDLEYRLTS